MKNSYRKIKYNINHINSSTRTNTSRRILTNDISENVKFNNRIMKIHRST